ncbi:MAG: hypothetical protein R3A47_08720 [Polyangiales bacterium]
MTALRASQFVVRWIIGLFCAVAAGCAASTQVEQKQPSDDRAVVSNAVTLPLEQGLALEAGESKIQL